MDTNAKKAIMKKLGGRALFPTPESDEDFAKHLNSCENPAENAWTAGVAVNFALMRLIDSGMIDLNKVLYTEEK